MKKNKQNQATFCISFAEGGVFNEGITEIGASVFSYANIGNIRFADSLKTVKERAFLGTSVLKEIVLPENVDEVGNYVGMDSSIEKIVFKNNVTKCKRLFIACSKLYFYQPLHKH